MSPVGLHLRSQHTKANSFSKLSCCRDSVWPPCARACVSGCVGCTPLLRQCRTPTVTTILELLHHGREQIHIVRPRQNQQEETVHGEPLPLLFPPFSGHNCHILHSPPDCQLAEVASFSQADGRGYVCGSRCPVHEFSFSRSHVPQVCGNYRDGNASSVHAFHTAVCRPGPYAGVKSNQQSNNRRSHSFHTFLYRASHNCN